LLGGALVALVILATGAGESPPPPAAKVAPTPEPIDFLIQRPAGVDRAKLELRQVVADDQEGSVKAADPDGADLSLSKEAILTDQDVTEVHVTLEPDLLHYAVTLHFNEAAADRLKKAATNAYGTKLAMLVNGQVLVVGNVMSQLSDTAMISGRYTKSAASHLAEQLAP